MPQDEKTVAQKLGYSFADRRQAQEWRDTILRMQADFLKADHPTHVFHGTSLKAWKAIQEDGFHPTDIHLAINSEHNDAQGSFWGDPLTAACYAEDTAAERHPGSEPVLLAIELKWLTDRYPIFPDLASLDFPMKGLGRMDDPRVMATWQDDWREMDWQGSLRDLGAIVAMHDDPIPAENLTITKENHAAEIFLRTPEFRA